MLVPLLKCTLIPRECCHLDPGCMAAWRDGEDAQRFSSLLFAAQRPAWLKAGVLAKLFCGFWVNDSLDFCHDQAKAILLPL